MLSPVGITVGHWEGPRLWGDLWWAGHDTCAQKVRVIQNYHMNNNYSDIAYNEIPCPHGWIFEGRGYGVANGASGTTHANTHRYAVCALVGLGDPIAQMPDLFDALNASFTGAHLFGGAPARPGSGHRDVVATMCPGDVIDRWADAWSYGAPIPAPAPAPGPAPDWRALRRWLAGVYGAEVAHGPTLRLGSRGHEVTSWQHALNLASGANLATDGHFGPQTRAKTVAFQRFLGIAADGIVGPQSRRTMVAALGQVQTS